jgi:outer membrane protein assembly factor BamB
VPGQRVSEEDDRQYAEPVDPWATAEAAAVAAGGHPLFPGSSPPFPTHAGPTHPGPTYPGSPSDESGSPGWANGGSPAQPGPPGRPGSGAGPGGSGSDGKRRGRGRRAYAIGALTLTVVLAAGAALTWHFWPGYRALDYRSLTSPQRIKPAIPVDYTWSDAEVLGDRVYFASSDTDTGAVGVVAIDAGDKAPAWTSTAAGTPAGPTTRWRSMVALPVGVALFTETDTTTGKRDMAVLDAEHGTLRWHRALGDDDDVFFAGDVAVLVDRTEHRLLGVTLTDGKVRWEQLDPKTDSGTQTSVVLSTSPDDLAGPATVAGRPLAPDFGGDPRIVQISADQTARVLDARSGKVLGTRANVAGTNDEVIAHNGRLIVRESENAQRIVSYGLDRIGAGQPHVLYSAQAQNGQLSQVTPCGDDRVCLVEEAGDAKSAEVVAVDAAKGGRLWHRVLPDVTALIPVGEAVLADTTSDTTLLDANGGKVWTSPGVAARLNGGNLLEFNQPLSGSPGNPALAGQHLGDDPVQLGPLSDVRSETCSWNTSVLACVAEKDFVLQHFTK